MELSDVMSLFASKGKFIESIAEFNQACEHIALLLEESEILFHNQSYSTSVFLAISSIEETAKAHLGPFTAGGTDPQKRKGNIFYDHGKKHQIAARPTVPMGKRLQQAIGDEAVSKMMELSHTKELLTLRENSLYFGRQGGKYVTPRLSIEKNLSRTVLLFAIEVFDDALVGFTNYSMDISKRTDTIFNRVMST
jgi:AbiV family abortive infection protein